MQGMTINDPAVQYGPGPRYFHLATGSPGELGLLKALGEAFGLRADAALVWHKNGTGQSLRLLKERKVDMVMVHAPDAIEHAVAQGWATGKTLIGSNEFYMVGPADDPADIANAADAIDAYRRIAAGGFPFISRGDNSGTHQKEMLLWSEAGRNTPTLPLVAAPQEGEAPPGVARPGAQPAGDWYIVTGDFMTASLKRAETERGYYMTDSSTWIMGRGLAPSLRILFRGDRRLVNVYHALLAPAGSTPGHDMAQQFVAFLASIEGQQIIREFGAGQYPEALYNDANYARQYE